MIGRKSLRATDMLSRLHKDLQADGYEVEIRPRLEDDTVGSLCPDLLARKPGHTVLVGIKTIGAAASAEEADRMRRLAEAAQAREDWQFRLILAEAVDGPAEALPRLEDIKGRLGDVRRLYRKGDQTAAYLLAWALMTAAGQRRLSAFDVEPLDGEPPQSFVKILIAHGLAGQDDAAWLDRAAVLFARLASGHVSTSIDRDLFDRLCAYLTRLTQMRHGEIDDGKPTNPTMG